jgi:hypothetical protein
MTHTHTHTHTERERERGWMMMQPSAARVRTPAGQDGDAGCREPPWNCIPVRARDEENAAFVLQVFEIGDAGGANNGRSLARKLGVTG